jgi:hypothetical protein
MSSYFKQTLLLAIPLALSTFTHLWNPIGFPYFFVDEGSYILRAMQLLDGLGPQIYPYDHPYFAYDHPPFGWLFLASSFNIIGFPDYLSSEVVDLESIKALYIVPRVVVGILAVFDTFLVYKIVERKYSRNILAFIAAVLFAIMPTTWLLRWVNLDSLLLPLVLLSVLFAVACKKYPIITKNDNSKQHNERLLLIILSGLFLGLAIFTKIPAFTAIPVVGFLIYSLNNNNLKILGLWFIPVLAIPAIWPIYSISVGEFDGWIEGINIQTHREGRPLIDSIYLYFKTDPVLLILGIAGLVFATIKRDLLPLLWIVPFLCFLYFTEYSTLPHFVLIFPALCISTALLLIKFFPVGIKIRRSKQMLLQSIIISGLIILGVGTTMLVTLNVNGTYIKSIAFLVQYLSDGNNRNIYAASDNENTSNNTTPEKLSILGDARYFLIPKYVYDLGNNFTSNWEDLLEVKNGKFLFIVDGDLISNINERDRKREEPVSIDGNYFPRSEDMEIILSGLNNASTIATFKKDNISSYQESLFSLWDKSMIERLGDKQEIEIRVGKKIQ